MCVITPRVSYVVTSYNYGKFVTQAIDSLLGQTFEAIELIVIDDASTDETPAVLARYADEPRVRLIRHERNQGHIRSYNEGLALARGELVGVFSADDFCVRRDAVARAVAMFDAHPRVGMVYAAYAVVEDGRVVKHMMPWPEDRAAAGYDEFRSLMWGNYVLHSGTLLRRDVQDALGPYDARLTQTGDWDMWLRAAILGDVGYIAEPLFAYRMHRSNMQNTGIAPREQATQNVLTLERAFALLPPEAPADIRRARVAVLRHALLQTVYFDLFNGRRRRAWHGLTQAIRRRPSILLARETWQASARLVLLTAAGRERYRSLMERRERLRPGAALR
jgi:glycosyltransferase involved in cell wall biosynthesis